MSKYGNTSTPKEVMLQIAKKITAIRKEQKITQKRLSEVSGVAYATIKKFESTGIIAFESLLKISNALNRLPDFEAILIAYDLEGKRNLFDV